MNKVNEGSTANLALSFYDQDRVAVAPGAARYRIDDVETGTMLKGWTEFTPTGTTHDLKILALYNRIVDTSQTEERHRITIEYDYGTVDHGTGQIDFYIRNLQLMPRAMTPDGEDMVISGGTAVATGG